MKNEITSRKSRNLAFSLLGLAAACSLVFVIYSLQKPTRSVTSFCNVLREQNDKLAGATGDTYSVKVFAHRSSDPHDFVVAFTNLDKVAPKEIEQDVSALRTVFDSIDKNPSQALGASLSGLAAETSVTNWTAAHCGSIKL